MKFGYSRLFRTYFGMRLVMLSLAFIAQSSLAASCDDINAMGEVGIIGEADFDYGPNSEINGNVITGGGNTPTPIGSSETVDLVFPDIDPVAFPPTGGTNLRPPSPPTVATGSYGTIEFGSTGGNTLVFTGGNYRITKLILKNSTNIQLAPGSYFIQDADFGNSTKLTISPPGQVKIYIKNSFKTGNQSEINSFGNTGNLIFYLYDAAKFELGNANLGDSNVDFNGIIYSPFPNTEIKFGNNNEITGAILSAGSVDVGNNTAFDYSADVQATIIGALGCEVANHIRIEHDGSGVPNTAEAVTVKICANDACSSYLSFQNSALLSLISTPSTNSSWSINPVSTVGGVGSSGFTATVANSYSLGIGSFSIGGSLQSSYTVKCLNTATSVLSDCNMVIASSAPDHYAITHSELGITCEAESITITPHDSLHGPVSPSSSTTITLSTSIANDGWALRSGNGVFTAPNQYRFDGIETSAQFWLTKTTATAFPHMNINVSDGTAAEAATEDPVLEFRDTALRFYADTVYNDIGTQIAGKSSGVATASLLPPVQALTLRAIQTNTDTGACETRITGPQTVQMAFECVSPATCKNNTGVSIDATAIQGYSLGGAPSPLTLTDVNLNFDATGTASWTMNYLDAGQIALHASLALPATPPNPSDLLEGVSNTFTSKPAGLCVSSPDIASGCAGAPDVSCSSFKKAGEGFNLSVKAVAWESAVDTDFCTANATTPNFQLAGIGIGHNPVAPAVFPGTLGTASLDIIAVDNGDATLAGQTVSEVGVFTFTATPPLYFGEAIAAATSANIGRFYPDHFALSLGTITNRIALGGGGPFTYLDEDFELSYTLTAQNSSNATTQNYSTASGFALLDSDAELNYGAADSTLPINLTGRLTTGAPVFNWINGVLAITDTANIARLPAPDGPFPLLDVGLIATDNDGVLINTYDMDVDADAINDHALIGSTQIRYGRMALGNAFGSELTTLSMPMTAQYFDGSNFVLNTDDNLTALATTDLILTSVAQAGETDGDIVVTTGNTSIANIANNPLLAGDAALSFCPPGSPACTPASGNSGSIDVQIDLSLLPYLKFDWLGTGDADPIARATFGIFSGNSKQIYYRQIYQQ